MRIRTTFRTFIGLVLVVGLMLTGHFAYGMGKRVPAVGTPAAEFQLSDLNGTTQRLSQYRGKIVLLNFWATWCKPCTTEMPAMQTQYDKLRDSGFVVLAINELEDVEKVREHIHTYAHTFPVLLDADNRVANLYGVYGLPVSVFIDADGRVQEYIKGGRLTEQRIGEVVARIRGETTTRAAALP
jgi:peroxiredoxin